MGNPSWPGNRLRTYVTYLLYFCLGPLQQIQEEPIGSQNCYKKNGPFPSDESRSDEKHRKVVGFVACILFFLSKFMRVELNPKKTTIIGKSHTFGLTHSTTFGSLQRFVSNLTWCFPFSGFHTTWACNMEPHSIPCLNFISLYHQQKLSCICLWVYQCLSSCFPTELCVCLALSSICSHEHWTVIYSYCV